MFCVVRCLLFVVVFVFVICLLFGACYYVCVASCLLFDLSHLQSLVCFFVVVFYLICVC